MSVEATGWLFSAMLVLMLIGVVAATRLRWR
jgi:hypothetical protein